MTMPNKRCLVAYATAGQQFLWPVELAAEATVADVIAAARKQAGELAEVPWDAAPVGIFGELCERTHRPQDGDRIELYRPLNSDPRDRRRARAQQQRRSSAKR
jgi:uncharacterized protein